MTETIRALLDKRPFQAFRIVLSSGDRYQVMDPHLSRNAESFSPGGTDKSVFVGAGTKSTRKQTCACHPAHLVAFGEIMVFYCFPRSDKVAWLRLTQIAAMDTMLNAA